MSSRLVCGIGHNDIPGYTVKSDEALKIYYSWRDMLKRVTNPVKYPSYVGCRVCDEWLYLSNYVKDIKGLPGYRDFLKGGYELDKDIRLGHCMVYDKEHCMFVPKVVNIKERVIRCGVPLRGHDRIVAYSPNGQEYRFESAAECERDLGVRQSVVQQRASKKYGSELVTKGIWKGWRFEYE